MFGPVGNIPSQMKHEFSRVPKADIQRSTFNRSHDLKTTFDAGYLSADLCGRGAPWRHIHDECASLWAPRHSN